MMPNLSVRFGTVLSTFQALHRLLYYYRVTDQFKRLNAVLKEFEVKAHREQPFLKIKMIDLNRNLPLYRRLDEKTKDLNSSNKKELIGSILKLVNQYE